MNYEEVEELINKEDNNRVKFNIFVRVVEDNEDDRTILKIGDGQSINPYIRAGQEVTARLPVNEKHLTNIGKKNNGF